MTAGSLQASAVGRAQRDEQSTAGWCLAEDGWTVIGRGHRMPVQAPHALWLMEEKGDSRQPPGELPSTCSAPLSVLHPALILAAGEKPCCELLLGWDKLGNPQQRSWADLAALVGNL